MILRNNALTSAAAMGQVGIEWSVAGFGPINGAGASDMLMRNSNSGAFEGFDIVNNTITSAEPMGQSGLEWSIAGIAWGSFIRLGPGERPACTGDSVLCAERQHGCRVLDTRSAIADRGNSICRSGWSNSADLTASAHVGSWHFAAKSHICCHGSYWGKRGRERKSGRSPGSPPIRRFLSRQCATRAGDGLLPTCGWCR